MTNSSLVYLIAFFAFAHSATAFGRPLEDSSKANETDSQKVVQGASDFFEKRVRPILVQRCQECHSKDKSAENGHLAVDSREGLLRGGDRGPILIQGKPESSLLLKAVSYSDPKLQMPPEGKLPTNEIEILTKWISDGAFIPEYGSALDAKRGPIDWNVARQFWSIAPFGVSSIPDVRTKLPILQRTSDLQAYRHIIAFAQNPIDAFVESKLIENGLQPSPLADRRTLIRRLSFDLLGLPPTMDEVDDFVADQRDDAYERLVDRILASPHFGERWGRHWLDMTRYVDEAPDWQKNAEGAWMYRDWVIRSLNEDLPYSDFVKRQLAADMLDDVDATEIAALGFLGLSPTYWKELKLAPAVIEVIVADEWDERIDTVTRTFLGLTVACARCHDHKFDPITTQDYYALAGVFASIDLVDRPLMPREKGDLLREARAKVASMTEALKKIKDKESEDAKTLQNQVESLQKSMPDFDAPFAPVIDEASVFVVPNGPDATRLDVRKQTPRDLPVFRRGNPGNPGEVIPRGYLELFASATESPDSIEQPANESITQTSRKAKRFEKGSGRRELADAILADSEELVARVQVNRMWSHHFGKGLVRTTGDFGNQGNRPSHPELLDWLSQEFVDVSKNSSASGRASSTEPRMPRWQSKRIHRMIVTSATYRQRSSGTSSELTTASNSLDPSNQLLWQFNRQQLEIEPWRDAVLMMADNLDDTMYGKALSFDNAANRRRTLYGIVGRDEQHDILRLFDFPPPTNHSPSREFTITPLQQLFVLNSPFVTNQSTSVASSLPNQSLTEQITFVHRKLFQRIPDDMEIRFAMRFLQQPTPDRWRLYIMSLLGLNEFQFVD